MTIWASNRTLWCTVVVPELSTRLAKFARPASQFDLIFYLILLYLTLQMLIPNKITCNTNSFSHLLLENSVSKSRYRSDLRKQSIRWCFGATPLTTQLVMKTPGARQIIASSSFKVTVKLLKPSLLVNVMCTSGRECPRRCNMLCMWWLWRKY